MTGGRVKWEGKAGDAEGDGMDKEGVCLDVPEVSASRIIDNLPKLEGLGKGLVRQELEHLDRDLTSI